LSHLFVARSTDLPKLESSAQRPQSHVYERFAYRAPAARCNPWTGPGTVREGADVVVPVIPNLIKGSVRGLVSRLPIYKHCSAKQPEQE
jgi:hypothetical protein